METPKKIALLQKEASYIIRKTLRPISAMRNEQLTSSPSKRLENPTKRLSSPSKRLSGYCKKSFYSNSSPTKTISSLRLSSTCWCLYDSKNNKQMGFRTNYQRQIASLTKIMTVFVTIQIAEEFNINMNMLVRVTDLSAKMIGTTANLKAGTWLPLGNLLYGAMLPSGNDAAYLLSEVMGYFLTYLQRYGSESCSTHLSTIAKIDITFESTINYVSEFIKAMNFKADDLGLNSTRFSNPHGLQNALNTSSAKDMIVLSIAAANNPLFHKIMNTSQKRYEFYTDGYKCDKFVSEWVNTNMLLKKGWEGIKTGVTVSAGGCLASLKNGVYIVVLNCMDVEKRFSQTERIYEFYVNQVEEFTSFNNDLNNE